MFMHKRNLPLLFLLFFFYGCATAPPPPPLMYWPNPPDEPRVAYVESHRGKDDYRQSSFLDAVFGAPPASSMARPYGVAAQGNRIFVADSTGGAVLVFDDQARSAYLLPTGVKLDMPIGVVVAANGIVFVSDAKLKRVFGFDPSGKAKVKLGEKNEFQNPAGMAVNDKLDRLYIADSLGHAVKVYSITGEFLFEFGTRGSRDGEFNFPSNVAIDRRNGNVVVSDTQNFRVQVFDSEGKFIRKFGEAGDVPGSFSRPKGVGVDSEGHIYVVDAAFSNFQIFDETGQLLLWVGTAGRDPGQYASPAGLYVDEKDRIYVTEAYYPRVDVFQYLSDVWKKEHPEEYKKYLPKTEEKTQEPDKKPETPEGKGQPPENK